MKSRWHNKLKRWFEVDLSTNRMIDENGNFIDQSGQSFSPSVSIISDKLDNVWNPADGKIYDSKSKYYAAVKAHGGEIIGNEQQKASRPQVQYDRRELREQINAAWSRHS